MNTRVLATTNPMEDEDNEVEAHLPFARRVFSESVDCQDVD